MTSLALTYKALQDRVAEVERLAEGWKRSLTVCERLKRLDEGRPLLEIVRN